MNGHLMGRGRAVMLGCGGAGVVMLSGVAGAGAAGSGYGGTVASGAPAAGFSAVVTARSVPVRGGRVSGSVAGTKVTVTVPRAAARVAITVAITAGHSAVVRRDLPKSLRADTVLTTFGVELRRGATATRTTRAVTVTLRSPKLAKGEVVVIYDARTGRFTKVAAKLSRGRASLKLSSGEAIAVLGGKQR